MEKVSYVASVKNDRPQGPIPSFIGGDNGWQLINKEPLKRAHGLLTKFAPLMVEKGLLAE